jgi:YVTN family beta-propeller protein
MRTPTVFWSVTAAVIAATALVAMKTELFPVLSSTVTAGRQKSDFYLTVTSQLLRPAGQTFALKGRPVQLAMDPAGSTLAVLNSSSVMLRDATTGAPRAEVKTRTTSWTGLAFRPGSGELWASEATRSGPDSLAIIPAAAEPASGNLERIEFTGHPVPAGIAFSADGHTAYVALSRTNTLAVIDTESRRIVREVPVGVAPHAVVYDGKRGRIYVSNRGGRPPVSGQAEGPSAGVAVAVDPKTGATLSGTVSIIDAKTFSVRDVAVGRSPSNMALSPDGALLAVADSHSDSLSLLDSKSLQRTVLPVPATPPGSFGSQPVDVAFSADAKMLYVACAGDNAISAFERTQKGKWQTAGAIPTGWFPSSLLVDNQGDIRVASVKGTGNTLGPNGTHNSRNFEGQIARIARPAASQLAAGADLVAAANQPRFTPAGGVENLPSLGIRHVVLIIKENRTYDQVFGDMAKGNSDPSLVMYGRDITPNHHKLADEYVLLDNFYATGAISFEGHQWLMQGFVSDYVERALVSAPRGYAWNLSDAFTVSPAGFFWQSAPRPLDVRLFGPFSLPRRWDPKTSTAVDIDENELLPWTEYWRMYKEGKYRDAVGSRSGVPALEHLMATHYPASSMRITDQIRADIFLEDIAKWEKSGHMPDLSILTMTSDHTVGTTPGNPTPAAMVADNDLALGRMIEGLSKSRFWPQMLVLVVEDDAQNGVDHVDGHRTVALAVGPHVRRKTLDSNFYTQVSMIRTIQEIFRIPPRTRFLVQARPMTSLFQPKSDAVPYKAEKPAIALDTMNPPLKALRGRALWAAKRSAAMNWAEVDDVPSGELNRILWWDRKGYETAYPRKAVDNNFRQ